MKLILIRHPETEANALGHYIGHTDSDYTELGRRQFEKVINRVEGPINQLFTSPLYRCKTLAEEVSKKIKVSPKVEPALAEINFGIFEGKHYSQLQEDYRVIWDAWVKDYVHYKIPNGESLWEVHKRIEGFLAPFKKTQGTYLCITHGGVIQSIITLLLDLDINQRWHFKIPNGAIVEISYDDGYGVLEKLMMP